MEVTLGRIWNAFQKQTDDEGKVIGPSLMEVVVGMKGLAARVVYRIVSVVEALEPVFKRVEEQRRKLVEKHGTPNEKAGGFRVSPEKFAEFQKELSELMDAKEEVAAKPVELPEDFSCEQLTPALLLNLKWMFTVHTMPELTKVK